MIRNAFTTLRVPCPDKLEYIDIECCRNNCGCFNDLIKDENDNVVGVDCLYPEMPSINCHITSFTNDGYHYKVRKYDIHKDGPIESFYHCNKCCFRRILSDGSETCLLVFNSDKDSKECYQDEFWEKFKDK